MCIIPYFYAAVLARHGLGGPAADAAGETAGLGRGAGEVGGAPVAGAPTRGGVERGGPPHQGHCGCTAPQPHSTRDKKATEGVARGTREGKRNHRKNDK